MKTSRILAAALVILGLFSFAYAIHETIPAETQIPLPGPDAAALYAYITKHKSYTDWELWPGKNKMYKGAEPHGALLTTYVNDTGIMGIKKKKPMPEGTIIAQEDYGSDKNLVALSVMYKIKGFNPEVSDWFWAKYAPDGKVLTAGRATACITCHEKMKDNDYVFTGKLK